MRRPWAAAGCLVLGVAIMVMTVAWTTPFGAFPDELDHYERALSIGNGQVVGQKDPNRFLVVSHKTCCTPGNDSARSWVRQGVRMVSVEVRQRPELLPCTRVVVSARLRCGLSPTVLRNHPRANAMGTIEPLAYVPGGLAAHAFGSPLAADRALRLVTALVSIALVGLGMASLRRRVRGPLLYAGVVLYLSFGTLCVLASGSPNALEAASTVTFLAGAFAVAGDEPVTRTDWWCVGAGGFVLSIGRSLGPIWILALVVIALLAGNWRRVRDNIVGHKLAAAIVAFAIAGGALHTVVWEAAVQPHVVFDFHFFLNQIRPTLDDGSFVSRQFVAAMGSLPPAAVAWTWIAGIVLLAAVAAVVARGWRAKTSTVAAVVALVGAFVFVSAAVLRQNGFGIQARHVLPMVGAVTVTAGVALGRRRVPTLLAGALALAGAVLLVICWCYLRGSYFATPAGLAPTPVSIRGAVDQLTSWWSIVFVAGALLATGSITLSALAKTD